MTQPFSSRFTLEGHPLLDAYIKKQLKVLVRFLCERHTLKDLAGIWLGGSYGRGEGGVIKSGERELPWGDYDIFLIYTEAKDVARHYQKHYTTWEQELHTLLKFNVQLRTPGSLSQLFRRSHELCWYDLCQKHQKLWISPGLNREENTAQLPQLSPSNGVSLLFRAAGMSLTQNAFSPAEFYRTVLAACDSILIASSSYHFTLQGRLQNMYRLQQALGVSWLRELFYLQQEAARYRLSPSRNPELPPSHTPQKLRRMIARAYLAVYTGVEQHGDREAFTGLKLAQLLRQAENLSFLNRSKKQTGLLLYLLPFLVCPADMGWPTLHQLKPYLSMRLYRKLSPLNAEAQREILLAYFLEKWTQFQGQLNP